MKIAVLGAGAWGTAISITLAARHAVSLWARDAKLLAALRSTGTNQRYLPGIALPPALGLIDDLAPALEGADLALLAVPTNGLREVLRTMSKTRCRAPLVWLCKGFETDQAKLPHQVCAEELPASVARAVLSGPSFAEEVARGLPAALTLASDDAAFARTAAAAVHGAALRVYLSTDVLGVEAAGAVKNVIAIAAGISDGLGLGLSARAALMTRGLAEMTRLGVALGGRAETFMGLAGAGDLILTCTGDLSRNRRVGLALARATPLATVLAGLGHTAEGVHTARAVAHLAGKLGVEMPITRAVCLVLDDPARARVAVQELMAREQKSE
ncbi:MAG: NAD(P)-dependent glycerol-3-phosphate dehydrogenase [Betaproteobacteria bacterium]|nr:NAD(P)-dependent glycerol-3-phosphate dehydrogenase [Betaproteobacteria bacterium]MDH3436796.1 NAD(P)-dependent glycerol-3-phosphate dehydrogenase [Betaproteobacteria bacterium]